MTEFVGRTGSKRVYSYPTQPRFANLEGPFARNSASGPTTDTPIVTTGTQVNWDDIASTGAGGVNIPITPKSTGIIRVTGMFEVTCAGEGEVDVEINIQIGGVTFPIPEDPIITVRPGGGVMIPFVIVLSGFTVGATTNIQMLLTAEVDSALTLEGQSSVVDVQEVSIATG